MDRQRTNLLTMTTTRAVVLPEGLTEEQLKEMALKHLKQTTYVATWKREYYKKNKAKVLAYQKEWLKSHPQHGAERSRRYYAEGGGKDKKKAYYLKNVKQSSLKPEPDVPATVPRRTYICVVYFSIFLPLIYKYFIVSIKTV